MDISIQGGSTHPSRCVWAEATAVFRNEARNPERTIPRATYYAVGIIGSLYFVSSWLVLNGIGVDEAVAASQTNPESVVIDLAGRVIAPIAADIVQVLIVSSMFACMLAFHNIVTRYLFTLGQREVLHGSLAIVHPKHRAPSRASLWVSGVTAVVVIVSALLQLDPVLQIYTWYSGAGAVGVIVMMALTSAAVLGFAATPPARSGLAPQLRAGYDRRHRASVGSAEIVPKSLVVYGS